MLNNKELPLKGLDEYVNEVANRMGNLDVEEAKVLAKLNGSQELITIGKILGPEISPLLLEIINEISTSLNKQTAPVPKKKGLGAPV